MVWRGKCSIKNVLSSGELCKQDEVAPRSYLGSRDGERMRFEGTATPFVSKVNNECNKGKILLKPRRGKQLLPKKEFIYQSSFLVRLIAHQCRLSADFHIE